MKLKSKGSLFKGYRRLYLKKYGEDPFIELQFSLSQGGVGITWFWNESSKSIYIDLLFIKLIISL